MSITMPRIMIDSKLQPLRLIFILEESSDVDQVVAAMRDILDYYLPPPAASVPAPGVFAVSITERSVGFGNWRGMETRGVFPLIALKGVWLDAVVGRRIRMTPKRP